uniref:Uncharacterized protein n=1 Tax=Candidatus Nitrotoga fabula TaxID=2182327 RepID=A0A2X0SKD7_9PROT|nr:protein of unknown function [Candidatus Nitrotoga fabula]
MKKAGHTQSEIANVIDRSVSTISRAKGGIRADLQGGEEDRRDGDRRTPCSSHTEDGAYDYFR